MKQYMINTGRGAIEALTAQINDNFGDRHTFQYWFRRIPDEDVRNKALANLKDQPNYRITKMCNSLQYAIWEGFLWQITPEGHEYWKQYYITITTN